VRRKVSEGDEITVKEIVWSWFVTFHSLHHESLIRIVVMSITTLYGDHCNWDINLAILTMKKE
jgi:hypothetical protein